MQFKDLGSLFDSFGELNFKHASKASSFADLDGIDKNTIKGLFKIDNNDISDFTMAQIQATEPCKGNCKPIINGAWIGYYSLNVDFSADQYVSYHIWTNPISVLEIANSMSKPQFNLVQILRQIKTIGNETGTGKFTLEFPANYTGKITAKILGR